MTDEFTWVQGILVVVEGALLLSGALLFWRLVIAPRQVESSVLPHWDVRVSEFLGAAFGVIVTGLVAQGIVVQGGPRLLRSLPADSDWWLIAQGAAFQGGMLLAALAAGRALRSAPRVEAPLPRGPWLAGLVTFLIVLPVVVLVSWLWRALLQLLGASLEQQVLLELFRDAESLPQLLAMGFLAVVVAPITEELIFRAGLFRYLRTRVPRILALVLPSLVFSLLHGNAAATGPLVALGIVFSLAYERTGRIAVPMVAHALFNLHTVVLLSLGIDA